MNQYVNEFMKEEHWKAIFSVILVKINADEGDKALKSRYYNVIMAGFIFNPKATLGYLSQQNLFQKMIELIVVKSAYFQTSYDRKVLILGLISLLKEKINSNSFDQIAQTAMEYACYNLNIQKWEETKTRRRKLQGKFTLFLLQ